MNATPAPRTEVEDADFTIAVFAKVVELGSFRRAGLVLGLRTNMASSAVRSLEQRHGAPLLTRADGELRLTEVGARLLRSHRKAAGRPEAAPPSVLRGRLGIDLTPFEVRAGLVGTLTRFQEQNRRVRVHLATSRRPLDPWPDGLTAALRLGDDPCARTSVALGEYTAVLCASPGYLARRGTPYGPDNLRSHDLLPSLDAASGRPLPLRLENGTDACHVTPRRFLAVEDLASARHAVEAGCGIAALPVNEEVRGLLARRSIVAVLPGWTGTPVKVRLHRSADPDPALDALQATLEAFYRSECLTLSPRREP